MNTLTDLLTAFPNCRVTISSGAPRRKPRQGDRKHTKKHGWLIRRQQTYQGMSCVRGNRPVWEWVREDSLEESELNTLRRCGAWRDGLNPYSAPATPISS